MQMVLANSVCPPVPAGYQWEVIHRRSWAYLILTKETWYGRQKKVGSKPLSPRGMGLQHALADAADEILRETGLRK